MARGMPGVFRCDRGDYTRMLILFCMRGCGRIARPAFPAPSEWEGEEAKNKTRVNMRGEIAESCSRHCEEQSDEAIHSSLIPGWCASTRPGISRFPDVQLH